MNHQVSIDRIHTDTPNIKVLGLTSSIMHYQSHPPFFSCSRLVIPVNGWEILLDSGECKLY